MIGFDWNTVSSKNDERTFINFEETEDGVLSLEALFECDEPFHISKDKFGNDRLMFKVTDSKNGKRIFSTSSKRCLAALKEHLPLKDKILRIVRTGSGFDTEYIIEEI